MIGMALALTLGFAQPVAATIPDAKLEELYQILVDVGREDCRGQAGAYARAVRRSQIGAASPHALAEFAQQDAWMCEADQRQVAEAVYTLVWRGDASLQQFIACAGKADRNEVPVPPSPQGYTPVLMRVLTCLSPDRP